MLGRLTHIYFCSETEELSYLLKQLSEEGYVWKDKGYKADDYFMFNVLFFKNDFLTNHTDNAVKIFVYERKIISFEVCGRNSVLFFKTNHPTDNYVYPERVTINTSVGKMHFITYLEIIAKEKGYYNLKAMKNDEITLDIEELDQEDGVFKLAI